MNIASFLLTYVSQLSVYLSTYLNIYLSLYWSTYMPISPSNLWHRDEHCIFFIFFADISKTTEDQHAHDYNQHQETKLLVTKIKDVHKTLKINQPISKVLYDSCNSCKTMSFHPYKAGLVQLGSAFQRIYLLVILRCFLWAGANKITPTPRNLFRNSLKYYRFLKSKFKSHTVVFLWTKRRTLYS